jgi:hypothetical protein
MTANVAETGNAERQLLFDVGFTAEEIFDITDIVAYFKLYKSDDPWSPVYSPTRFILV